MREKTDTISNAPTRQNTINKTVGFVVVLALLIALRVIALDSDPYTRLSWSGGLLTDEGFYSANARNGAVFGQERLDEWNNAVLMPTLHFLQRGVFAVFGAGIVQARLISVVLSLLTLWFLFDALRRVFGERTAWLGTVFLGFDHTVLLYNRMALMDTPGACVLTAAFWAFVRGTISFGQKEKNTAPLTPQVWGEPFLLKDCATLQVAQASQSKSIPPKLGGLGGLWIGLCGVLVGLAYATRGLAVLIAPVPLIMLWRHNRKWCRAYAAGLTLFFCVYLPVWYLPYHEDIGRYGRFYLDTQILPHSLNALLLNMRQMLWGERGGNRFFLAHSPVLWVAAWYAAIRRCNDIGFASLRLWFALFIAAFACSSYAPSRYYVLFAPALASLAAIVVNDALNAVRWRKWAISACVVWSVINAGWLAHWLFTLRWTERDTERWLVTHLPADSVLIGDAAPTLTLNTRFRAVTVQPGLCNDHRPFDSFTGQPRYLVMINEQNNYRWLERDYSDQFPPENRVQFFPDVMGFGVVVYRFP